MDMVPKTPLASVSDEMTVEEFLNKEAEHLIAQLQEHTESLIEKMLDEARAVHAEVQI